MSDTNANHHGLLGYSPRKRATIAIVKAMAGLTETAFSATYEPKVSVVDAQLAEVEELVAEARKWMTAAQRVSEAPNQ